MARSGLDIILIDLEHGHIDHGTAHAMIAATAGSPLVPLVRVAATSVAHAKMPLDLGAMGVCFAMITTRRMLRQRCVPCATRLPASGIGVISMRPCGTTSRCVSISTGLTPKCSR
jgi:2-keto-3-deoxy-L-rhamnonate aldolase RhmA